MKIGMLILMVLFLAMLVGLFYISYKMLLKVRQEERAANANQPQQRQLHPKLQAQLEQQKKAQDKDAQD
ncbi:hypothetical protein ABFP25_11385 [Acinetobacter indicus]|uniref:DUF2897 family protein n=1 Tax=Acinetobacter indicus TaxID=756892 RepID=A0AAW8Z586_9GAMM|nr:MULTISPECIES: hypothetical protein [Acinetobacter]ENW89737.1 hypothetical protein F905_01529 [Acinetobacter sp. CIP 53.82]MBA0155012.1 hypothetical protein [Acinetobacter indicus]MCO8088070.1 hypothetical protein [Acinetobacter indicus]MCO8099011.1 hypothetical protein [Acinetobacter indicus]MCO8101344.1 hypothetical protein [Acinetobacter indicus]